MSNRYWVGGTGTWNGTSTTNWSASSGGASGASVPTSADNVFFDANSNTGTAAFTVTMATVAAVCADFDATAVDGVMTLGGTVGIDVYGSLLWPATNFSRAYTGTTTFRATTTGKTITTSGLTIASSITFDGVGGGWTLGSAITTSSNFTLTNGSLNLGGFTATGFNFGSNNSNTRTLAFNGGTFAISGTANTGTQTLWNCPTATGLTVTGTPTVNVINNSTNSGFTRSFSHGNSAGGSEANSVNLNIKLGDVGSLVTLAGTFKNVDFTGCSSTLNNGTRYIFGDFIVGSGMTLTAGTSSTNFAKTSGTQQITSSGLNLDFPINFGYSFATLTASGDGTTATLTFSTSTGIPAVGSTITVVNVVPSGYNGTYTVTASTNTSVSYANATTGAQTVAGVVLNGGSTTYTLQDALNVGTSTARTITLNTGTLNLNNFTLTNFGAFSSGSSAPTRAIAFGTGNITCTYNLAASNTVWNCAAVNNFSVTGTPTVNLTGNSSGAFTRTVSHGSTSGGTEPSAVSVNVSAGSDSIQIAGVFLNVNLTGFAGTFANNTRFIYGNLILASGISSVAAGTTSTTFAKTSGTQQITSAGYNFDFPINFGYNLATTAATGDGTTATLTIGSTLNCIAVGSTLIVSNVTPSGYNGTYTVTASTNSTVSYLNATTGAQTVAGSVANGGSTTYTLQDALSVGTSTTRGINLATGTLNLNNFTLTNFGSFGSSNALSRSIAFGTGNYTNTSTASATIWGMATATGFTYTGTPTVNVIGNAASGGTRVIQYGSSFGALETTAPSFNITNGADSVTLSGSGLNVNTTGFSGSLGSFSWTTYGNFTLGSTTTVASGTSNFTFASTNATTRTITTNGVNIDRPITFSGVGGSWQLQDALTVGTTRAITLNNGSFSSGNQSITTGLFNFSNSNTKTLTLGTSTVTITGGTSTTGFVGSNSGTTYDVVNSTIVFTNTGTFSGGQGGATGNQFGTITMSAASGTLYLGLGTVARCTTLNNTVSPCTITNACTTGFTVDNFNVNGTAGNLVTLNSTVAGTARTISKSSGTVSANYLSIQDSTATGGATWNAYNSVNVSNNTGWNFLSLNQGNFLMFF